MIRFEMGHFEMTSGTTKLSRVEDIAFPPASEFDRKGFLLQRTQQAV
jgi:hypothetical protein